MTDEAQSTPQPTPTDPPKENSQGGMKNLDWKEVFKFYCEVSPDGRRKSYKEVSEKFGVSERMVEEKGRQENWVELRDNLGENELEAFKVKRIDEILNAENRHLKTWRSLQATALELLKDLRRDIETARTNTKVLIKVYPTATLREITSTLDMAINGERVVLGLPTSVSKSDITTGGKPVTLTNEMMAEIDAMFEKNKHDDAVSHTDSK